jgi:hypothetical protein
MRDRDPDADALRRQPRDPNEPEEAKCNAEQLALPIP